MTPKQYADLLKKLGYSKKYVASRIGIEERTFHNWFNGRTKHPEWLLLEYWLMHLAKGRDIQVGKNTKYYIVDYKKAIDRRK
ncbi:MAG: hypothetical protein ABFD79_14635 [Phycisphaerales bacterium]